LKTNNKMPPQYYFEKDRLGAAHTKGRVALLLDFDGTLLPIMKDPEECYLSPETKGLLESILGSERAAVVILSGRSLSDLRKRLSIRGAFYAGSHGVEISGPGVQFVHRSVSSAKPVINRILQDVKEELASCEGVYIEEKPYSFALHYRNAAKETASLVRESLYRMIKNNPAYRRSLTILRGKKVLELLPSGSQNKGEAAIYIMERLNGDYLPVCVGDDTTDEALFRTFYGAGLTIRVGYSRKTAADYYLNGQWEVPILLRQVDNVLRSPGLFGGPQRPWSLRK
jgi:trehalose 6-phosphate phosphatase